MAVKDYIVVHQGDADAKPITSVNQGGGTAVAELETPTVVKPLDEAATVIKPVPTPAPAPAPVEEVAPEEPAKSGGFFTQETLFLILVLAVALVSHAFNMFNFPLYRQDEGIVSENAWSFLNNWQLSPYTYNYEHPPFTTFILAIWTLITGGFHTFGPSINSGRVLMLALHLGGTFFIYRMATQLGRSVSSGIVAALLFSLSPLALNYQRLLVVDNFMVFWLLAALYFLICNRSRLFYYFLGSLAMGLAVVSRETALIFLPAYILLVWKFADPYHRLYARSGVLLISGVISLQYFLYAIFKSELVPDNWDFVAELEGKATHVSLLGTLYQRYHTATSIWQGNNAGFNFIWQTWLGLDSVLIFVGLACIGLNFLTGFKRKEGWVIPLLGGSFVLFAGFGGLDSDYMAVVVTPFLALAVAQTVGDISKLFGKIASTVVAVAVVAAAAYFYVGGNLTAYTSDVNGFYQQTISWIKSNIPGDRSMIITDALWVDLHDAWNGPAYPVAHSHWKAANDPAVRYGVFKADPKNVDYIITTAEMRKQFKERGLTFPQQVLDNSGLIRKFEGADEIWINKVNNKRALVEGNTLQDAYAFYKSRFIASDGRVGVGANSPTATMKISSQQQADGLMMALWNNDQQSFDLIWSWTSYNLQLDNNLFRADGPSQGGNRARNTSSTDAYTSSRADTDIAMALLLAAKRWQDDTYSKEAQYVIESLWNNTVIEVNKKPYMKASASPIAQLEDQVLLNLGAFNPVAYRMFGEVDKKHNWPALYESGYDLLGKASWYGKGDYKGLGIAPGLVVMNLESEELRAVNGEFGQRLGDYDEEAQQAVWHVLEDYQWNKSARAQQYIEGTGWFLVKNWQKWKVLTGQYTSNGLAVGDSDTLSTYAIAASEANILNQLELAKRKAQGERVETIESSAVEVELISQGFMGRYYRKEGVGGYWLKEDNIGAQQWGWLGTAMYLDKLNPNFPDANSAQNQPAVTTAE